MKSFNLKIKKNTIIYFLFFILLFLISGFREVGIDLDSVNYSIYINKFIQDGWVNLSHIEPSFFIITYISNLTFSNPVLGTFLIYSFLGLGLKFYSIYKYSLIPILSIIIYISLYFILHEMTQIRVGVASGIFLYSIKDIKTKNFSRYFIKFLIAFAFHYTSIIMIPLYFLTSDKINIKNYLFLPLYGVLISFTTEFLVEILFYISNLLPELISYKLIKYLTLFNQNSGNGMNYFGLYSTTLLIFYYIFILNIPKFKSEYDITFLKLFGWMLFVLYSFINIPIFASRGSQFIGVILIILIPNSILIFKQKKIPIFITIIFAILMLYNYIFIQQYISV